MVTGKCADGQRRADRHTEGCSKKLMGTTGNDASIFLGTSRWSLWLAGSISPRSRAGKSNTVINPLINPLTILLALRRSTLGQCCAESAAEALWTHSHVAWWGNESRPDCRRNPLCHHYVRQYQERVGGSVGHLQQGVSKKNCRNHLKSTSNMPSFNIQTTLNSTYEIWERRVSLFRLLFTGRVFFSDSFAFVVVLSSPGEFQYSDYPRVFFPATQRSFFPTTQRSLFPTTLPLWFCFPIFSSSIVRTTLIFFTFPGWVPPSP